MKLIEQNDLPSIQFVIISLLKLREYLHSSMKNNKGIINKDDEELNKLINIYKNELLSSINSKYFGIINTTHKIAVMLLLKFKNQSSIDDIINPMEYQALEKKIIKLLDKIEINSIVNHGHKNEIKDNIENNISISQLSDFCDIENFNEENEELLSDGHKEWMQFKTFKFSIKELKNKNEIIEYITLKLEENMLNPMKFFYDQRKIWLRLYILARRIFVIQASNAGSERCFSIEGLFINKQRTNMTMQNINDIILINSWKKCKKKLKN